jgi:hypothetical protein
MYDKIPVDHTRESVVAKAYAHFASVDLDSEAIMGVAMAGAHIPSTVQP